MTLKPRREQGMLRSTGLFSDKFLSEILMFVICFVACKSGV